MARVRFRSILRKLAALDYILIIAAAGLSVFGVLMIYTATNGENIPGMITSRFGMQYLEQRLYVITGFVLMLVLAFVDYRLITRFYWVIYVFLLISQPFYNFSVFFVRHFVDRSVICLTTMN
jgi:cell division protein FtsW (lipid II flippase)